MYNIIVYSLGVKLHQWIVVDVGHIDGFALSIDIGVFALHQPTDVREEEASVCVVWVGVRLTELVMHSVVANPIRYVVLRINNIVYNIRMFISKSVCTYRN